MTTYCLVLWGSVPNALLEQTTVRFGPVLSLSLCDGTTRLDGQIADQSGLRALLNMVWDMGATVRLLSVSDLPEAGDGCDDELSHSEHA